MIGEDPTTAGGSMASKISEKAEQARDAARQVGEQAREMGAHAREVAGEKINDIRDRAGEYYEQGRQRADEMQHWLEECVQQRPLQSLMIAAGVGLIAGFMLRNR